MASTCGSTSGSTEARVSPVERRVVGGVDLEILRRGAGSPLVLLHGLAPIDPAAPFLERLASHAEVIAPTHPGFGHSTRPDDFDTVYDLVHLYLGLLEALPYEAVTLVGLSFGGWLAAEIAAARARRVRKLVLVDAVGIKVSGRETADVFDLFNRSPAEAQRRRWHDPVTWAADYDAMEDEALVAHARNRDALCLYAWQPYMYNPQLARWLRHVSVPTLVLWGASDGIVSPVYGRAYSALIPGARFELIDAAGHHPEIEQPTTFVERVVTFVKE
jgi:pimeloyl-ACP methyl ester carboxylesterase